MSPEKLMERALEARERSYCPYSGFSVGAALLCKNGKVYEGCNIENAAYTPTNCAERTAFFGAVAAGEREFEAIAVCGGKSGEASSEPCMPCGVCRQVMKEFCGEDFRIYVRNSDGSIEQFTLEQLLPHGFGLDL